MKRSLPVFLLLLGLAGCATLPSTDNITKLYESEHADRKVLSVAQRDETVNGNTEEWYEIFYTTPGDSTPQSEIWKYHEVGLGWEQLKK